MTCPFLSGILVRSSACQQVIVFVDPLAGCLGKVKFCHGDAFPCVGKPCEDLAPWRHDLTLADIREIDASPVLASYTVGGCGEDPVFEAPGDHRIRAVRHDEVGGMDDQLRPAKGKR